VGQNAQEQALRNGVDILVATPGRLLDLMQQGFVSYKSLEVFVLDEADRMLDMGFIHDVKRVIAALPKKRQTLFFSATMPPEIQGLANSILTNPVRVEVAPVATTAETIDQRLYFVEKEQKRGLLVHLLQTDRDIQRVLVFTRTKHGANRVAKQLEAAGIGAEPIHGNKSQNARERALAAFKSGACRVLVATDIAARGIDIDGITHVINFDLPNIPETYVHRIGRTGRAGAAGIALSFCDTEERAYLKDIERIIRRRVPVVEAHPHRSGQPAPAPTSLEPAAGRGQQSQPGAGPMVRARPQPNSGQGRGEQRGSGDGGGRRRRGGGGGRGGRSGNASGQQTQSGQRPQTAAPAAPSAVSQRPRAPKWL
jgi:ATP-dependent RNA helicase RhlE